MERVNGAEMSNQTANGNKRTAPASRRDGLVVQKLEGEVVVFDTESQKAHCLNETAAMIWEHCDGKKTISELSVLLPEGGVKEREEMVWLALDQLEKSNLLQASIAKPAGLNGLS